MRAALLPLVLSVAHAATEGPVAFGGSSWYLADIQVSCTTACTALGATCDGDALRAFTAPVETVFEDFIDDFAAVGAGYCTVSYPKVSNLPSSKTSRPMIGNPTGNFVGECHVTTSTATSASAACGSTASVDYRRLCACLLPSPPSPPPSLSLIHI